MDRISTPDGVGDDTAEDVFGGLDAMLKLSWPPTGTKVFCNNYTNEGNSSNIVFCVFDIKF